MSDLSLVQAFMTLDEVWCLASDDSGLVRSDYFPEYSKERLWLGVYEGITMIGMLYVHSQNTTTLQIHPYLLNGHKHKIRRVMDLFFKWAFSMPLIYKINVAVPFMYKKMRNCCLKVGFKDEGINRMSYKKNGILMDQWHMGICRGEL
jgi:RimJ/RimL family protein N-acetyltransferase